MKRNSSGLGFLNCLLKKFFFNKQKNDIYQECINVVKTSPANTENEVEEYLKNYQATTRWQTV